MQFAFPCIQFQGIPLVFVFCFFRAGGRKEGGVGVRVAAVAYLLKIMPELNFNKIRTEQNI